jgi:chromosome segregation ATPase
MKEAEREEMLKRIESLEAELARYKSESQRIELLETKLERYKNEWSTALEDQKARQRQALKEVERSRAGELESHTKAIGELRRGIERHRNVEELIALARTETERQGASQASFHQRLDELSRRIDDQLRSLTYLEEQRRSDAKRVSEVQNETTDLNKRINLHVSKVDLLGDQIPQFGQFQQALEQNREMVQAEVARMQNQTAVVERQMRGWEELSQSITRRLGDYESRVERHLQQFQVNRKVVDELEAFQEQLIREQREFIELQRLAFDRQQTKLQDQEAIQEKVIREQSVEAEKRVNEISLAIKRLEGSVEPVLPRLAEYQRQINGLLKIIEEDIITRANNAHEWMVRFEQLAVSDE